MARRSAGLKSRIADVDQHSGQRGQRHVLQDIGDGDEQDDHQRRPERAGLGAAPGRDDSPGPGWTGVDGERAHETREHAPRADAEEVAAGVGVVAALIGEGARGGRRLGHDDQRDDRRQRRQAFERGPRQPRQPDVRGAALDGAEHGDTVRLQPQAPPRVRWSRPGRSGRRGYDD